LVEKEVSTRTTGGREWSISGEDSKMAGKIARTARTDNRTDSTIEVVRKRKVILRSGGEVVIIIFTSCRVEARSLIHAICMHNNTYTSERNPLQPLDSIRPLKDLPDTGRCYNTENPRRSKFSRLLLQSSLANA